tara:strand:+ start:295 stop:777 length:483 start_codon:yes stop_codon:yes gene_type:complete
MRARVVIFFIVIISGLIFLSLSFISNKTVYSNFHKINKYEWLLSDTLVFEYSHKKSNLNNHNIRLFGEINQLYSYSNLYLFVDIFLENKKIKRDTLNCILYDKFGYPKQKNIGNTQFFKLDYLSTFKFEINRDYKFKIVQGMRDLHLKGVENIGIKIKEN